MKFSKILTVLALGAAGLSAQAKDFDTQATVTQIADLQWKVTWADYLWANPTAATTQDRTYPENRVTVTPKDGNRKTYLYWKQEVVFPDYGNYLTVNLETLNLPDGNYEIIIPEGYVTLVPGGGLPWEDNVTQYIDITIGGEVEVSHAVHFTEIEGNYFDIYWDNVTALAEGNATGAYLEFLETGEKYEMKFLKGENYSEANLRINNDFLRLNFTNNYPDLRDGRYRLYIPAGYVLFNGSREGNAEVTYDFDLTTPFMEGTVVFNGPFDNGTVTITWADASEVSYNEEYQGDPIGGSTGIFIFDGADKMFNIPYPQNVSIEGNVMTIILNGLGLKSGQCQLVVPDGCVKLTVGDKSGFNGADDVFRFVYVNPDESDEPEVPKTELYPGNAVWSVSSGNTVNYGTVIEVSWPGTTIAKGDDASATVGLHNPASGYLTLEFGTEVWISEDSSKLLINLSAFPSGTYRLNVDEAYVFINSGGTTYYNTSTWLEELTLDNSNPGGQEPEPEPEPGTIDYTYAEGNLAPYGKGKKETVDIAMCINDPGLAGMKVKGFRAYINGTQGFTGTSLWMTKTLAIENKENVADIASYEVTPRTVTYGADTFGLLEVTLPEPYELTDEPLYLGYSLTIDDNTSVTAQYPVIISRGVENSNGMWVHMSKSILKWLDYNEEAGGVAFIVAQLEGNLAENSLGFAGYEPIYAMNGEGFDAEFSVSNIGLSPVSTVKYTYSYDDAETLYTGEAILPTPIEPAMMATSPMLLSFEHGVNGFGPHTLHVCITEVNGMANESQNATADCRIDVIPFVPVHRPLVEEYTGVWCGWCPHGYIGMEMIAERYAGEQVSICYHQGDDPMAVTNNFAMPVSSFPNGSIDRVELIDPYYGSSDRDQFGIADDLEKAMAVMSTASIDVEAAIEGNTVMVNTSVRFIKDMTDARYEIGYVLTCSGLTDPDPSVAKMWAQTNYYSGRTDYRGTPLEILTTWPDPVYGLEFNDVAIDVKGMTGVAGSLPSTIVTNTEYIHTFSFDIADNALVQNRNNLKVAAYIIDKTTGRIDNANEFVFKGGSSGTGFIEEAAPAAIEYYDLSGRRIANPAKGIYVRIEKGSDGSTKATKVLVP